MTISDQEFFVNNTDKPYVDEDGKKQTWKDLKTTSLIMPASSQAKISAYIINACKQFKNCKNDIGKWSKKAEKIQTKARTKK